MNNHQLELAEAMKEKGRIAVVREVRIESICEGIEEALNRKGGELKKAGSFEGMWEALVRESF